MSRWEVPITTAFAVFVPQRGRQHFGTEMKKTEGESLELFGKVCSVEDNLELIQEAVFSHPGRSTAALWVSSDIQRDNSHLRHNRRRLRRRLRRRRRRRPPNQPS